MGRPRKLDIHLPMCVHHRHGAYYLVKKGAWTRLGSTLASALTEYARRFETPKEGGMAALIEEAFTVITKNVAANTKTQYRSAAKKLKVTLRLFSPDQVRQKDIARVKLDLAETPNMANQVLSFARLVFAYAVENQLIDDNPALGIKPYPEAQRERLILRSEYDAIYAHGDDLLQISMDLLYLTDQRVKDVLKLPVADIVADGIYFRQQKTKARLLVKWNPELRAVVDRAKALHGNVRALTLLYTKRGKPPSIKSVRERWNAACIAAGVEDAQLRDIRAQSATDAEAQGLNPQGLLGHTTRKNTKRYLRSKTVPQVEGPSFGQVLDIGQKKASNQ